MGERKGQNHYYPPDFDPVKHKNLNKYHGVHALRERAHKIHLGILVIRFEMPFDIWCLGCGNHVAMSVRFNAEKKRVGEYYSTPIHEFRMKCHRCDNYFTIRTDPKNFDYELVEGLRRQEKRWDPAENGGHALHDRSEGLKLASDPMYKLDHTEADKIKAGSLAPHVEQIERIQERMYDDFGANSHLRRQLRAAKKESREQQKDDDGLRSRLSLEGLPLVPEHDDDRRLAKLMARYTPQTTSEERQAERRRQIVTQSIFHKRTDKCASNTSTAVHTNTAVHSPVNLLTKHLATPSLSTTNHKRTHNSAFDALGPLVKKKTKHKLNEVVGMNISCESTSSSSNALGALALVQYDGTDSDSSAHSDSHNTPHTTGTATS